MQHQALPTTPAEAAALGMKRFFTGLACRNGHVAPRCIGKDLPCVECVELRRTRRKTPIEIIMEQKRAVDRRCYQKKKAERPEALLAKAKRFRDRNPEQHQAWNVAWRERHWQELKPRYVEYTRARQAQVLRAMPPWANRDAITAVYEEAARKTLETGIEHHVDHEIPLRGKLVSGLHVHTNLKAIPARENLKKGNRYGV